MRTGMSKSRSSPFSPYSPKCLEGALSEVSVCARRCLAGQLDAAVRSHREGRVPRHFPQEAVGVREDTVASEEDLVRLLDYRGSGLGGFRKYRVHLLLLSHVVRQREAREPAVLYVVYIDACVGSERRPWEEGNHHPTCLEERHLLTAHVGLGPPQAVTVEGDGSLEVAHAERDEAHPRFHCPVSFSWYRLRTTLSPKTLRFHRLFTQPPRRSVLGSSSSP